MTTTASIEAHRFGLTHGDYGGRNILVARRDVVGIIDFDRLDQCPPLYDLAWVLFFDLLRRNTAPDDAAFISRCVSAYAGPPERDRIVDWPTLPYLFAYVAAYGVARAHLEPHPAQEAIAFGQALCRALQLIKDRPAILMPSR